MTSSIQAFNPSPSLVDYAMTKAAQVAFVKALAEELGPEGHPRQRRRARSDLDPAHPRDGMGCRAARDVRPGHAARPRRPAGRARGRVRVSRERRRIVRVGRSRARHRRKGSLTPTEGSEHASRRGSNLKDRELYEELRDEGDSKEKAARISNAVAAEGAEDGRPPRRQVRRLRGLDGRRSCAHGRRSSGIRGYSGKRKAELISMLRNH